MYKKYELVPNKFTQGVVDEDGKIEVVAIYEVVDPEKELNEKAIYDKRFERFDLEFDESESISWDTVDSKVNDLNGIVSTY